MDYNCGLRNKLGDCVEDDFGGMIVDRGIVGRMIVGRIILKIH